MNIRLFAFAGSLSFLAFVSYGMNSEPTDSIDRQYELKEVVVTGFGAERNLKAPEMGRVSITGTTITNMPVMFGEPDIVKTLQTQPGVSQGVEGFTGLYVHGGENDQNLFLYEGLPLYHVSHLGGIFSSFNVATVNRVDFYKSSFPARYGGRISSITDVEMKPSDMKNFHGRLNIGLLSANAYITGPLIKDKTAFSVGIRRSWIDLISVPTLAIINSIDKKKGNKIIGGYAFTDFNARIDHKFNNYAKASIIGYYGHDRFKLGERDFQAEQYSNPSNPGTEFFDENTNKLSWGNWGVLGKFSYTRNINSLNVSVYYSSYASTYRQDREYQSDMTDQTTYGYNYNRTKNSINDIGINTDYLANFSKTYNLRAGAGFIFHEYLPEDIHNEYFDYEANRIENNNPEHLNAHEGFVYLDNTINIADRASLSIGARGVIYNIQHRNYTSLEPRAALRVSVTDNFSIKLGYSKMSQHVQQISTNYINLPTDLWQPISAKFEPVKSDQFSAGVYGNLPYSIYFSVEGWYKDLRNLLEYREGITVLNPDLSWEDKLTSGKGWSYGVDLSLTKEAGAFTGTLGYGLMWNWRKFDELNKGNKFPAKFDNRHKININVAYKLNDKIDFNAGWTYMTGNRLTLSLYNYDTPWQFPDAPTFSGAGDTWDKYQGVDYYSTRNNIRMPAFHRLDLGVNFNQFYNNGRRGIWNLSIYNAYCHMNAITIKKDGVNDLYTYGPEGSNGNWHRAFKTMSFLPIIPSVSYTYIF